MHFVTLLFLTLLLLVPNQLVLAKEFTWQAMSSFNHAEKSKINDWLTNGIKTTKNTFIKLPFKTITFQIQRSKHAKEPVPWGQVNRSQLSTIYLQLNPRFTLQTFNNDWTLYHEIAHLYLPFLEDKSLWLSEGFASYLQNIMMLKHNIITKQGFIKRINAGLSRGKVNTSKQLPLKKVTRKMRAYKAYMRVYWSGAAYFIEADFALQQQGSDLIKLITRYADCCLSPDDTGTNLTNTLDRLSNSKIFSQLYSQYQQRIDFPKIESNTLITLANYHNN